MTKPIIKIHNAETDEVIEREMTDKEFAQYQADQAEIEIEKQAILAREQEKSALLKKLGITEEEAALLLG